MLYVPTVWNPHSHKTATTPLPLVTTATITGLLSSTFSRKTSPPGLGISDAASASRFQFESGPASLPGPGSLFSLNSYAADLSQFQTFCLLGLCRCCKNRGPGASREDSAPTVVTGTLGGSVILPLQLQDGQQVENIYWMCRLVSGVIATVTLVEAGGPDTFYQAETQYWGRLSVMGPGCSLQISHLSWEGAGSYRAHVNLWSSRITHAWEYSLHVYGPGILGGESVGEIVISTLGKSAPLPLEVLVGQEVEKVTWSSPGLVAILQPGRAGKPILVAGMQGPKSRRRVCKSPISRPALRS
ncbi:SLAM family member 5-like isoform X2 [Sagmatias obliquidens]|uniref:SLAM family member 5-like isoform X2 n=1 Tax=Sagmatias obliquidens TaxID=3371155 RepID=UPI000F44338F|nr:SLAM family member 5-like isoform X2 [Lagenorhynchus obliquidens]